MEWYTFQNCPIKRGWILFDDISLGDRTKRLIAVVSLRTISSPFCFRWPPHPRLMVCLLHCGLAAEEDRCSHNSSTYIFLSLHSAAAGAKSVLITVSKNDRTTAFCCRARGKAVKQTKDSLASCILGAIVSKMISVHTHTLHTVQWSQSHTCGRNVWAFESGQRVKTMGSTTMSVPTVRKT